jgi:TBC1 domain family member 20
MMHFTLSKLPVPFDLEKYISDTMVLYAKYPPTSLPFSAWHAVSSYSVLKTAADPEEIPKQDLGEARVLFEKHSTQVLRMEAWQKLRGRVKRTGWRYRRPAGAIGLAVAVGVLSWWLARNQRGILASPWLNEILTRLFPRR